MLIHLLSMTYIINIDINIEFNERFKKETV
ncbi:hypothetical protein SAMN05192545_1239 [Maribacter dokdonensis]|uniref:Uncharacterized protein n=1 Tax=Maribacter dokdonensis TaxID=320912 RepID=A0A1H4STM6_9FLAO|nr:hypothetical protein SAMN05192545_1239 [Maribacter dokdonensis]SEC47410.1 hypothetical protein SAMN05192540_3264 [Maribacter dokdonensis]